ncbi:Hypothetical protein NTJ_00056 [Nesidiocoris tenuis]|uniref:Uncharacterized protein n=1 Tax=Nesidiocoris tenuis TaxID=355587 RepID=A0ABN7A507_9HEMI|nr:Hypothetical protein NTJ_00056 [Nesidiocoris tenuis]
MRVNGRTVLETKKNTSISIRCGASELSSVKNERIALATAVRNRGRGRLADAVSWPMRRRPYRQLRAGLQQGHIAACELAQSAPLGLSAQFCEKIGRYLTSALLKWAAAPVSTNSNSLPVLVTGD